jgi:PD-(D/E)XK nuclease superfamily
MTEYEIARHVLDAAFVVHTKLGPGLFETVYEVVLAHELRKKKLRVSVKSPCPSHTMAFGSMTDGIRRIINGTLEAEESAEFSL